MSLSRRAFLSGSAAILATPSHAFAAASPAGKQAPGFYRYKVGNYELTAIHDGVWQRPIDDDFVRNATPAEVTRAMTDAFLPATGKLPLPFTALVVNTGTKLVLIDTGSGGQISTSAQYLGPNLAAAGISPKAIDAILISHFHPDHINGIKTKDGALVFPNAEVSVPAAEWDFFMDDARFSGAPDGLRFYLLNTRRIFRSIARNVRRFEPGREVAPGISAIAAPGHTPGHTAFAIASGSDSMLVLGDTTSHPALFVRHPQWQASFDMDGPIAAETRERLLDRAAADRMLVQGYHFPFPACGHIGRTGAGFEFAPAQWQPFP